MKTNVISSFKDLKGIENIKDIKSTKQAMYVINKESSSKTKLLK